MDLDRADEIEIDGTHVVGNTERFKDIVDVESGIFGGFEQLVGIQLHGFVLDPEDEGATISNVKFDGFGNALAPYTALIDIDPTIASGHFDYRYVPELQGKEQRPPHQPEILFFGFLGQR